MVTEDDVVTLIDFGVATTSKGENEGLKEMAGTPYFLSPGVIFGKYGKKADIWSCGVVLYVMIYGVQPFVGDNNHELFENIKAGNFNRREDDPKA